MSIVRRMQVLEDLAGDPSGLEIEVPNDRTEPAGEHRLHGEDAVGVGRVELGQSLILGQGFHNQLVVVDSESGCLSFCGCFGVVEDRTVPQRERRIPTGR